MKSRLQVVTALLATLVGVGVGCGFDGPSTPTTTLSLSSDPLIRLPELATVSTSGAMTFSTRMMGGRRNSIGTFERLSMGYEYHAWAAAGTSWTDLGTFVPGTDLTAVVNGASRAQISIEQVGKVGLVPSTDVVVDGVAGGNLQFGFLTPMSFASAAIEVTTSDDGLDISYSGLPSLPRAYYYSAWLMTDAAEGASNGAPIMVPLGVLATPSSGSLARYSGPELDSSYMLHVSIETTHGTTAMSPLMCFVYSHGDGAHGSEAATGASSGSGGSGTPGGSTDGHQHNH